MGRRVGTQPELGRLTLELGKVGHTILLLTLFARRVGRVRFFLSDELIEQNNDLVPLVRAQRPIRY